MNSHTIHPATKELQLIKSIAGIMDSKFKIPGTNIRFGLDPILGLIPGFGTLCTTLISLFLVIIIGRHGTSGKVLILMLLNILIDAIFSSIPVIGNIADIFYKANNKNIELLINHYEHKKHQSNGLLLLTVIFAILAGILLAIGYATFKFLEILTSYLGL